MWIYENTKRFKEKQPEMNVNDISDDEKIAAEIEQFKKKKCIYNKFKK